VSDCCLKNEPHNTPAIDKPQVDGGVHLVIAQLEMLLLVLIALTIFLNLGQHLRRTTLSEMNNGNPSAVIAFSTPSHLNLSWNVDYNRIDALAKLVTAINYHSMPVIRSGSDLENVRQHEDADLSPSMLLQQPIVASTPAAISPSSPVSTYGINEISVSQQFPRLC
jgi:hypothetical protein